MSKQYPGGLITKTPVTPSGPYENSTASGIWTLDQQAYWRKLNQWPTAGNPPPDAQFNYVTMLLHGDGTNGAQNNTFLDSSTNNFTITRNGNTTQGSFSPYGSNWSNYFDGTGDYLTVPDNAVFSLGSGNFTIEAWVNPTASPNQPMIIGQWTSSYAWTMQLSNDGNRNLRALLHDGSFQDYVSTSPLGLNTWNHCAFVRESNTVSLYLNGARVYTTTFSGTVTNSTSAVSVGADASGGQPLQGYISNARVVVGTALYSGATYTVPTAPLTAVSGTSLLTCQSNRFFDSSSTASAVTAFGNTSVQRFNPFGASTAYSTSVIGGSGYFDGTGDYLDTPTSSAFAFGTGDFTSELWVYLSRSNGTIIYEPRTSSNENNPCIAYGVSTANKFEVANSSIIITSSSTFGINQWHHVALVRSGTTLTLWVNGTSQGSTTLSTNLTNNDRIRIGEYFTTGTYAFQGYLSNLRVVKGTAVYTSAFTPSTTPLTAISGTSLLTSMINGAIFDNAMMNDLETVGNAQISTSVTKFGTGSISLSASGNTLRTQYNNPSLSIGTGNFTIEGWVYLSSTPSTNGVFQMSGTSGGFAPNQTANLALATASSSTWQIYAKNTFTTSSSTTITVGSWIHFALVRSGTTTVLYINGTALITLTSDSTNYSTPYIGLGAIYDATSYPLGGYIDDLRITKGYARYTATFTPPTAAFPDIGPT